MLFWFLVILIFVGIGGSFASFGYSILKKDGDYVGVGVLLFLGFGVLPWLFISSPWSAHSNDISKVIAQEQVIQVQRDRIESLTDRLDSFSYPDKAQISLDADSPWSSIIESIANAENALAEARRERAIAIRSIEARRYGPMSGVIALVGDYQ